MCHPLQSVLRCHGPGQPLLWCANPPFHLHELRVQHFRRVRPVPAVVLCAVRRQQYDYRGQAAHVDTLLFHLRAGYYCAGQQHHKYGRVSQITCMHDLSTDDDDANN